MPVGCNGYYEVNEEVLNALIAAADRDVFLPVWLVSEINLNISRRTQ
jgi:hypothetical protein